MLVHNAEIADQRRSLRCDGGIIVEIENHITSRRGEEEIDARGGALIPGLHDHHIHLLSLAAKFNSVGCGPPEVKTPSQLARALQQSTSISGWIRGTGYFESTAGDLDRNKLDALRADIPVRIQHRNGSMWFLNSCAIERLDLDRIPTPDGVERNATGQATGRLFRLDDWLREQLPPPLAPDLTRVGSFLTQCGVTSVTDATPTNGPSEAKLFRSAQASGALPQRIRIMGNLSLSRADSGDRLEIAEYKIMLDEPKLPELDALVAAIRQAHEVGRSVAIHTVTRTEIHFAIAAIEAAGPQPGDRLEHASVAPAEVLTAVHRLGLWIATQPNFVEERGDAYLNSVDKRDLNCLYRVRSWIDSGIGLAAGTDAPFGHPDPWRAIKAATRRKTQSGKFLGQEECISPESALHLFTGGFQNAQQTTRRPALSIGEKADLCLLDTSWDEARRTLSSDRVVATIIAGRLIESSIF